MKVSVIVASFGGPYWARLADRAVASVEGQGAYEVLAAHHAAADSVATARNVLAAEATGDWLCFLDADDELAPGYLDAMRDAHADRPMDRLVDGVGRPVAILPWAALLAPAVQFVSPNGRPQPAAIPSKRHCDGDIRRGSWLVIGTLLPRQMFEAVGGFRDYPMYEDWALFLACWNLGCEIVEVPAAVYRAHVRHGSRNRRPSRAERLAAHRQITADLAPELLDEVPER